MATRETASAHERFHNDGTLWARGELTDAVMTGYWEWLRKEPPVRRAAAAKHRARPK